MTQQRFAFEDDWLTVRREPVVPRDDARSRRRIEAPAPPPCTNQPRPVPSLSPSRDRFIFVRHPRARRYVVRVNRDGTVRVTIPRWGSKREGASFAESQRAWIAKQRERVERARPRRELPPEVVTAARVRAERELPVRLRELAARHGCPVARVSIRNQRSRWGSCSPNGHICLNWRLVLTPDWVRDYVLIHELMHLKRMDHSPKFWKLVEAACPDWRAARRRLKAYELSITT